MASEDKAPAFQFYVRDYLTDEAVLMMSYEQRGIYDTLLCHQWLERSISADPQELAKLLKVSPRRFLKLWPGIAVCFSSAGDGRLVNERLERQRREQDEYAAGQVEHGKRGAAVRWAGHRRPYAEPIRVPTQSLMGFDSSASATASTPSTEIVEGVAAPPVLVFPVVGTPGPEWPLTQPQIDDWSALYPDLNILAECRKALAYVQAKPSNRKTGRGMPAFLVRWFNRAVDGRGPSPGNGNAKVEQIRRTTLERDTGGISDWVYECAELKHGSCKNSEEHRAKLAQKVSA